MLYKCDNCGYTQYLNWESTAQGDKTWTCSDCLRLKDQQLAPENLRIGASFDGSQQLIIKKLTNELKELGKKDEEIKELKELVKTQGKIIEVLQHQVEELKAKQEQSELIAQIQQAPPAYKS